MGGMLRQGPKMKLLTLPSGISGKSVADRFAASSKTRHIDNGLLRVAS